MDIWKSSFPKQADSGSKKVDSNQLDENIAQTISAKKPKTFPPKQIFASAPQTTAKSDSLLKSVSNPYTNGFNTGKNDTNRRLAIEANLKAKFSKAFPR